IPAGTPQFPPEVLLASMLFVTVRVPSLLMAPPRVALLPEKVLLVTVREPGLGMAPLGKVALLAGMVQVVTVPPLEMAPPPVPTTQASVDEVAANVAKTSSARISTNRVRTVVVFIALPPLLTRDQRVTWGCRQPSRAGAPACPVGSSCLGEGAGDVGGGIEL